MEALLQEGSWRRIADICGWLAVICWLPYFVLLLAYHRQPVPEVMFPVIVLYLFYGPYVAAILALIAATARRWRFMLLAAASLAVVGYLIWFASRHPFDL